MVSFYIYAQYLGMGSPDTIGHNSTTCQTL